MRALPVLLLLFGCETATPAQPTPPAPPPAGASAVKESYTKLCAPCHAADMNGGAADHAPSLITKTFLESASDTYLIAAIGLGRPGTSMGAYSKARGGPLDDNAMRDLVKYIRGDVKAIALPSTNSAGDVVHGASVYQTNCQKCHGDTVARGEAVHLANPRFLDSATDSYIRYAIVNGRPGTKMEAWGGKLSDADIDDAVAYVRNFAGKTQKEQNLLPAPTGKEPLVINPDGKDPGFTAKEDRFVSVDAVKAALDAKRKIIIIDARPPSEWRQVHVAGAVSIPYHDMKRLDDIPKDGTWVVSYCACPHHLSGIVTDELKKRGYKHAVILDEGINEWHRRGYPVVAAEGVKPPPAEPTVSPTRGGGTGPSLQ